MIGSCWHCRGDHSTWECARRISGERHSKKLDAAQEHDRLRTLAKKALERFEAMGHEEQAAYRRQQAISFAYGSVRLSNPDVTIEMVEREYDRLHPAKEKP